MRQVITTKDGSHTITVPEWKVSYHSLYGAIQESQHVYIKMGLLSSRWTTQKDKFKIFEMGWGTGLNALLTLIEVNKHKQPIIYTGIEPSPLSTEEIKALNYCHHLGREDLLETFDQLHTAEWYREASITPHFTLHKIKSRLQDFTTDEHFDLIYYDAFAPRAQPELWTKEIFEKLYSMTADGGSLVTYCSKGDVRRAMMEAGFIVKKIPGPPGKREMLRAYKTDLKI